MHNLKNKRKKTLLLPSSGRSNVKKTMTEKSFKHIKDIGKYKARDLIVGDLFVGRTNASILTGPIVTKNFCLDCFKKRLMSSDYFSFNKYRKAQNNDYALANNLIKRVNFDMKMREIFVNKKSLFLTHYVLSVPGCIKCYEKQANQKTR